MLGRCLHAELCCRNGRSHDSGLHLLSWLPRRVHRPSEKPKPAKVGCSIPCNFVTTAPNRRILAAACSHRTNAQLSLHHPFWTPGLFTRPLKEGIVKLSWFGKPCFCNTKMSSVIVIRGLCFIESLGKWVWVHLQKSTLSKGMCSILFFCFRLFRVESEWRLGRPENIQTRQTTDATFKSPHFDPWCQDFCQPLLRI